MHSGQVGVEYTDEWRSRVRLNMPSSKKTWIEWGIWFKYMMS